MEKGKDNINLLQLFIKREQQRSKFLIKGSLQAMLDYLQYAIHIQFDKHSKSSYKFKKRKAQLDQNFIKAVQAMNRQQKVMYYDTAVGYLFDIENGNQQPPSDHKSTMTTEGFTRSFNLKIWKKKKIRLDQQRHILYAQKTDKIRHYSLGDYLLRTSKNKDYHCFVLQAINSSPHEKARIVHIGFTDPNRYLQWFKAIKDSIDFKQWEFIMKSIGKLNMSPLKVMASQSFSPSISKNESKIKSNLSQKGPKVQEDVLSSEQQAQQKQSSPSFAPQKNKDFLNVNQYNSDSKSQKSKTEEIKRQTTVFVPQVKRVENQKSRPFVNMSSVNMTSGHTIIDSLMQSDNDEQIDQIQEKDKYFSKQKKHLDLFHKMMPQYELQQLQSQDNFTTIINETNFRVCQHNEVKRRLKVFISFKNQFKKEIIFSAIANTSYMMKYNDAIEEINIKTMIGSENSAILYQKNKQYNKLYRPRDFVFLRHVFSNAGDLYLIDKNLENSHYPPFITIVRGDLCILWGILTRKGTTSLVIDMDICNQGYLNDMQQLNLTMKYVQGLRMMESRMKNDTDQLMKYKVFDLSWDITKNEVNKISNELRIRRKTERMEIKKKELGSLNTINSQNLKFKKKQQPLSTAQKRQNIHEQSKKLQETMKENEQSMILARKDMQKIGELDIKEVQAQEKQRTVTNIIRQFDQNGHVIISKAFAKTRFRVSPIPNCPLVLQEAINGHPLWKGQWRRDQKEGGFIFINQKKIDAQKDVLKFILSKIGKNLLSGKSVLNISLPVDIFSAESNLERLLYSMTYAPVLLQQSTKKSSLERLKSVIAFGLSNSPTYLSMEKPFNPILGETFSCWINGCPAYAEQISHHPPIGAVYMVGRGYRISAQLQSKVELHMNSGTGINDGIYRVKYDDGVQICFMTGGGQVSGLTYGDRRFNLSGKTFFWIQKENIALQISYNPAKKGFFSVGKQEQPQDYLEGTIYQVKPDFMDKFITSKRKAPNEKQFVKQIGKVSGIWNQQIKFDGSETLLDYDKKYPVKLEYEPNPLPSDANWREDIQYRRIVQVTRAQTQKQRLEVLQRNDRKLRETKSKKK